jgi:hypothetical protein
MRWRLLLIVLVLAIAGCATYSVVPVPGPPQLAPDKPAVVVTSAAAAFSTTGISNVKRMDLQPQPDLATAFERAVEPLVDRGTFRILSADAIVSTQLTRQTVILDMLVEADGRTYRTRQQHDGSAGWGNRYTEQVAPLLTAAAKDIVRQMGGAP